MEMAINLGTNKPAVLFILVLLQALCQLVPSTKRTALLICCWEILSGQAAGILPNISSIPVQVGTSHREVREYPRPELQVVPGPWGNLMSVELLDKKPCYKEPRDFHPSTVALPWDHFTAMKEGKIKALYSTAENSAITQVDTNLVYDCLNQLELIIVGDQVLKSLWSWQIMYYQRLLI